MFLYFEKPKNDTFKVSLNILVNKYVLLFFQKNVLVFSLIFEKLSSKKDLKKFLPMHRGTKKNCASFWS